MCRGGADTCVHRRCTLNSHQKQEANRRRVENRAVHNDFVQGAKQVYGAETAQELGKLPPRALYAFYLAMHSDDPRRANKFARSASKFPGRQNMVIEDTRDRTSDFGVNVADNRKKYDPGAIYAIQGAVLAADREEAKRLPAADRDKRLAELKVREYAINLGILDGKPFTKERQLTPDQEKFLARLNGDDLDVLAEPAQRIYDDVFMRHLSECDFTVDPRKTDGCVSLSETDKGPHYTLGELYRDNSDAHDGNVPLAEGLTLRRGKDGGLEIFDADLGVVHPASTYQRGIDAVALAPKITDVSLPKNQKGREIPTSVGQFNTEKSLLSEDSAKGVSHRKKLMAAAAQAGFASGVPVNAPGDGRDPRREHAYLVKAGLGALPDEDYVTRTEGFLMSSIANAAMRVKRNQFNELADKLGVKHTTSTETANGNKRTPTAARYSGDLPTDARSAAKRYGFNPKSEKSGNIPEVAAALDTPLEAFTPKKVPSRDGIDQEFGGRAASMVDDANRLVRFGTHPERVPAASHKAKMELEDAFHARQLMPDDEPVAVSAVATVPRGWDSDADGDFFDAILKKGSRVDTSGYTKGALSGTDAAKVREKAAREGQYVVKYLTTTSLRDGDDAVIGDGSRFIVHSVDRSKKIPVVYMVEDAYAADRAPATV